MSKDVLGVIKERRSIRSFKSDPLPENALNQILEAARWAPSAGNLQPWELYIVRGEEQKKGLAKAALGQMFLAEAPVVIVVCAVPSRSARRYRERGENCTASKTLLLPPKTSSCQQQQSVWELAG